MSLSSFEEVQINLPLNKRLKRRRFLRNAGALLGASLLPLRAQKADGDFSFILLGDLHYDKLTHHDMEWIKKNKGGDLRQIENYSRLTAEMMPKLFATVGETIARLNSNPATQAAFTLQVGDLVEGLCGTEQLAHLQNSEAVQFLADVHADTPLLFTKGNHDVTGDGAEAAFKQVFHPFITAQKRRLEPNAAEVKSARYTVEHQGALFCFFDAYDDESLAWLEATLAKRTARHCFVAVHPPVVPYGARATWHLYAREKQRLQREKLLSLLGGNEAYVLGGHIHKFNVATRSTPKGGRFVQLALSSVISQPTPEAKDVLNGAAAYNGGQIRVEPKFSPETEQERRAVYAAEKESVKAFSYADLPGYAVIKIQGHQVMAEMYAGTGQRVWKSVNLTEELQRA